jgi:protein O-GlcNAc transferase
MNSSIENLFSLGVNLHRAGRLLEAEVAYRNVLAQDPWHCDTLHCMAILFSYRADWKAAINCLQRTLRTAPNQPLAYFRIGVAYFELGMTEQATDNFCRAIDLKPDYAEALLYRGHLLFKAGKWADALADLDRSVIADPGLERAVGERYSVKSHLCDWRDRKNETADLICRCLAGQEISPLTILAAADEPQAHLCAARRAARSNIGQSPKIHARKASDRLRIAYVSPDYHDHVVAYQLVNLIEFHDKSQFETYGICLRNAPESDIRNRIRNAFDHFIECGGCSDLEWVGRLANLQVDIVVDLAGYTEGSRVQALASRPAPIIVSYLGFPGTTGADYVDYILADTIVIPPEFERYYSEKIVRLPNCFLPSDTNRHDNFVLPSRSSERLPEHGFVFCSFNHPNKISPEIFDVWMRLLNNVDGSVLWLSVANKEARRHLFSEAEARGIDRSRLIFADRTPERAAHHARIALADLVLDTIPYCGHATSSDMLWAGVPIVTCFGKSFASRVSASLLSAAGLAELIAPDLESYEKIAFEIATMPGRLTAMRDKLKRNRASAPFFDVQTLCLHIEDAYRHMWELHQAGQKPKSFSIPNRKS